MNRDLFYFEGDFRRSPKTDFFCAVCQRDIKSRERAQYVFLGDPADHFVAIVDLEGNEIKAPIGPECSRDIPDRYKAVEGK